MTIYSVQLRRLGLLCIVVLWLTLNIASLTSYPVPQVDDAWIGSTAVQFLRTGEFGLPIFGDISGSSRNYVHLGRLFSAALALVFKVFGVGLAQGRALGLVGALAGAYLLFALGDRLYGRSAGALAGLSYLFSWRVSYNRNMVRAEVWVNAGGLACLLLFLKLKEARATRLAFLLGLAAAALVDIYTTFVYYTVVVSVAMLFEFRRREEWGRIGAYALGGALGSAYWLAVHLLPDPALALAQWRALSYDYFHVGFGLSSLLSPLLSLPFYVRVGLVGYSRLGFLEAAYVFGGLAVLLIRRGDADKRMLWAWLIFWLSYFYIVPGKALYHIVLFLPFFCAVIAAAVVGLADWVQARFPKFPAAAYAALLAAPLMIAYAGGDAALAWRSRVINYDQYASQLRMLVPADASILGEGTWWWTFYDGQFTADHYLLLYNIGRPPLDAASIVQAVIRERNVRVILMDERLSSFYLETKEGSNNDLYVALTEYVGARCQSAGVVEGYFYGVEQGGPGLKRTAVFLCPQP